MGAEAETCLAIVGNSLPASGWGQFAQPRVEPPVALAAGATIRAALFDVEDVLYDASAWYRWLAQVFARLNLRAKHAEFDRLWRDKFLPAVHSGSLEFCAAFAECLRAIELRRGQIEEIVAATRGRRRRLEARPRPLPGVRSTLRRLQAAGIRLAILANLDRTAATLRMDLERMALAGLFDPIVTSVELALCLPSQQCYRAALAALGLSAHEVVFVGHDGRELAGARVAGLTTVAFNAPESLVGHQRIERFDDLADCLLTDRDVRQAA